MKLGGKKHSNGLKNQFKSFNALGYKVDKERIWFFKLSKNSLLLLLFAVLLNVLGRFLCIKLNLPVWGDFVGTTVAAIAYGPFAGALTGASDNIIVGLFTKQPTDFAYGIINAICGFIMGFAFPREKKYEDPFTVSVVGFYCAIAAAIISTPMNMFFYNGYTGNEWGDAMVDFLSLSISVRPLCCFLGEAFIDFPDKVITSVLTGGSYMFVRMLLKKREEKRLKEERKNRSKEDIGSILPVRLVECKGFYYFGERV